MDAASPTPTDARAKLAIGVVCAVLAGIAGLMLKVGNWEIALVPALAIVGLARRVRWGRRLAVVLLWVMLLVGVGLMLPKTELDQISGSKPVPLEVAVMEFAVCVAFALLGLHLLGRYKKEFRAAWF